jgi:hypothetical protein
MFEQFTVPTYHYSVSARGSFVLDGSTVRYVETINVNEGFTTRWEGDVVTSLGLLEDDIPYNLTRYLNDYMWRRTAHTSYLHQGHHDRTRAVAGDPDRPWTALGLRVPALSRDQDPQWNPEAAVRGTKVRWAGEQPPAAEEREWIGAPNQDDLPEYDPTYDFWHPSDLPPANPNPPAE